MVKWCLFWLKGYYGGYFVLLGDIFFWLVYDRGIFGLFVDWIWLRLLVFGLRLYVRLVERW